MMEEVNHIRPDPQDFAKLDRDRGKLPANASLAQEAEYYRLAVALKLIRLAYVSPTIAWSASEKG